MERVDVSVDNVEADGLSPESVAALARMAIRYNLEPNAANIGKLVDYAVRNQDFLEQQMLDENKTLWLRPEIGSISTELKFKPNT